MTQVQQVRVTITGRVQGVAYRDWTRRTAMALDLAGWVLNRRDGCVEALFSGPSIAIDEMIAACWEGPPAARVDEVSVMPAPETPPLRGFAILPTE